MAEPEGLVRGLQKQNKPQNSQLRLRSLQGLVWGWLSHSRHCPLHACFRCLRTTLCPRKQRGYTAYFAAREGGTRTKETRSLNLTSKLNRPPNPEHAMALMCTQQALLPQVNTPPAPPRDSGAACLEMCGPRTSFLSLVPRQLVVFVTLSRPEQI